MIERLRSAMRRLNPEPPALFSIYKLAHRLRVPATKLMADDELETWR